MYLQGPYMNERNYFCSQSIISEKGRGCLSIVVQFLLTVLLTKFQHTVFTGRKAPITRDLLVLGVTLQVLCYVSGGNTSFEKTECRN